MGQTNFEKLRVYQLAEQLADLIWKIVVNHGRVTAEAKRILWIN
jgi:hypothetical protein